jgi:PhoPQ-activated pathogenicity-related protein
MWRQVSLAFAITLQIEAFSAGAFADDSVPRVRTSLDRYVAEPDDSFSWKLAAKQPGEGYTTFVIDLKSQSWRTTKDVNRTQWQHWLIVVRPNEVKGTTGFLFIGGGRNGGEPPKSADALTTQLAVATNTIVAELKQVPNQPIEFHGDGKPRVEDDLIGYTWDKFMTTGDDTWPARLPMVKSVVRAMDAVQAFAAGPECGGAKVEKFVVAGASKRGWTTWCTAAVDRRVAAIVPLVIDVLNVRPSMQRHHDAYGFWAPAVGDYVHHKIVDRQDAPEYISLLAIEDPYSYRDRFTMPKYIVNASGDQYFLPDSSEFYFNDLPGEKYLRYVPNADHSLKGSDARESLLAYYEMILAGRPRPKFTWKFEGDGSIRVQTTDKPNQVNLWQATNPKKRDFRLETIGQAYTSTELTSASGGEYVGRVDRPKEGWTAFFIELVYDTGGKFPWKATTGVWVVPDTLPFKGANR